MASSEPLVYSAPATRRVHNAAGEVVEYYTYVTRKIKTKKRTVTIDELKAFCDHSAAGKTLGEISDILRICEGSLKKRILAEALARPAAFRKVLDA